MSTFLLCLIAGIVAVLINFGLKWNKMGSKFNPKGEIVVSALSIVFVVAAAFFIDKSIILALIIFFFGLKLPDIISFFTNFNKE